MVLGTGDGAEGCARCMELQPDFVILDVMLPNLNGAGDSAVDRGE